MSAAGRRMRGELARFLLVGATAVAIDFALYRGLLALECEVSPAKAAGYVGGAVFAYVANRWFTFQLGAGARGGELLRFAAVYLGALLANVLVNALVLALPGGAGGKFALAFICATGVSAALNFIGMKWLVFGVRPAPPDTVVNPEVAAVVSGTVRLSLVIPCYNEARNLPLLVDRLRATFVDADAEVILVDNGSTDDSPVVLRELLAGQDSIRSVRVAHNRGYGFGILAGLQAARGRMLGWTHADMQTDPADALHALELVRGSDAAVFVKGRRHGRPLADVAFTVGMSVFETVLLGRRMWDINAQPTLFPRAFFERWQDPPHDFALDLYAYHRALGDGLQVRRLPVRFGERAHGSSHWNLDFRAKLRFIRRTVDFSLRLRQGLRGPA